MHEYPIAEIDVLMAGYEVGHFKNTDLARWADRQIEAIEEPSTELLDLSMIGGMHPVDALNLLRKLRGTTGQSSVNKRIGFIGLLYLQKRIAMRAAIGGLFSLVHDNGINDEQRMNIYLLRRCVRHG